VKFSLKNLAIVLFIASAATAQEWTITTADFHSQPATLRSLSADGVGISVSGATTQPVESTVPLDAFVSAVRPMQSAGTTEKFILLLSGGDRLAGTPGGVVDEKLVWNSPMLGQLNIPLNQLIALGHGDNATAPDMPPKQDIVTLANGDVVSGVLTNCSEQTITISTDGGPVNVPLGTVNKAVFAVTGTGGGEKVRHGFRVRLGDGSMVSAADVVISQDHLSLTLQGKPARTVLLDLAKVVGVEQIDGPVCWVSSLMPLENVQVPYFGGSAVWPARFDASVDGSAIEFNGRRFDHGIGVHAYSRLSFAIEPWWAGFRTQYAIDQRSDTSRPLADVTVRIRFDGKVVYEQAHVRGGVLSSVVALEVNGAKRLTLEADYGDSGDIQAHLDWIEPALLRRPANQVSTAP
jgi:NPCBM/NEW2 domain